MATVVDALVVTLGLDSANFSAGQKTTAAALKKTRDDAFATAKDMQAQGKRAAEFFSQIRNEALGLFAIFLGGKGVGAFVADTVRSLSALGRAAHNIGLAVPQLAAFRNMIERAGGSGDAAQASLQGLSDSMERLNVLGDKSVLQWLQPIGGLNTDKPMELIEKFTKFAEENKNDPQRVNLIGRGLGIDQDTINGLLGGVKALREGMAESERLGVPTPEMAARAQALQKSWFALKQAAEMVGTRLLDLVTPALTAFLDIVTKLITAHPHLTEGVLALALAMGALKTAMIGLSLLRLFGGVGALSGIAGVFSGAAAAIGGFTAALSGFLLPLTALVAWWEALHIRGASSPAEVEAERRHTEDQAREHPEDVLPPAAPHGAEEWSRRMFFRPPPSQADPAQLMAYFRSQGWTEEQAAGILANFKGESNFNAAAVGDRGASAGLGQWRGARRDAFRSIYGHDVSQGTPMEQAQFTQWELTHTEKAAGDALRATSNRADAARVVSRRYERPGTTEADRAMNANLRAQYAMDPALLAPRPPFSPARQPVAQNDNSSQTHIGEITINTQATDANGIARSIGPALQRRGLVAQANTGLS